MLVEPWLLPWLSLGDATSDCESSMIWRQRGEPYIVEPWSPLAPARSGGQPVRPRSDPHGSFSHRYVPLRACAIVAAWSIDSRVRSEIASMSFSAAVGSQPLWRDIRRGRRSLPDRPADVARSELQGKAKLAKASRRHVASPSRLQHQTHHGYLFIQLPSCTHQKRLTCAVC